LQSNKATIFKREKKEEKKKKKKEEEKNFIFNFFSFFPLSYLKVSLKIKNLTKKIKIVTNRPTLTDYTHF
jgi:hypothetical protein